MDEKVKGALAILFAVGITAASFLIGPYLAQFESFGYFGAFLIGLVTSATIFLPAPGVAIIAVLGRSLDPLWLGIAAGIGSGVGELTGYLAGLGGNYLISADKNKIYAEQEKWLKKADMPVIFLLALIPNPIFDLAGIAAGALRIPVWRFLLPCILGKIIKFTLFAYFGWWSLGWF